MNYKEHIHAAMLKLSEHPKVVVVGYNIRYGSNPAAGTFKGVPEEKLIETPLAENLMAGVAIGLALDGYIPVLYIERFDFILNALDSLTNHLDKLALLSDGQFTPAVIIRVVVGSKKVPLLTGPTHCQDFSDAMRELVSFPIIPVTDYNFMWIENVYNVALLSAAESKKSSMIVEYKDLYNT